MWSSLLPFLPQQLVVTPDVTWALDLFAQLQQMILSQRNSPLEQEEVDIIVALGEEVSQYTGGVTTADLIGWQAEVDALDKIPHLSDYVLAETPTGGREGFVERMETAQITITSSSIQIL